MDGDPMSKRGGPSISVKMILTTTLLIVLIVVGFGFLNVYNVRKVYDQTTSDKIEQFRSALRGKGETSTQVFAQAMLVHLINNEDEEMRGLVSKTQSQDPELKL